MINCNPKYITVVIIAVRGFTVHNFYLKCMQQIFIKHSPWLGNVLEVDTQHYELKSLFFIKLHFQGDINHILDKEKGQRSVCVWGGVEHGGLAGKYFFRWECKGILIEALAFE